MGKEMEYGWASVKLLWANYGTKEVSGRESIGRKRIKTCPYNNVYTFKGQDNRKTVEKQIKENMKSSSQMMET